MNTKATKAPISTVPSYVITELGVAMLEGARKYGRHNYRKKEVIASELFNACWRHISAWWEGEDIDPDSGLSHIIKAMASLTVLRDAMMNGMWDDDRPIASLMTMNYMNEKSLSMFDKYPTEIEDSLPYDDSYPLYDSSLYDSLGHHDVQ